MMYIKIPSFYSLPGFCREVAAEFKRTDTLLGDIGRKDALVQFINAKGPVLLQYHVSATCKVRRIIFVFWLIFFLISYVHAGAAACYDASKLGLL